MSPRRSVRVWPLSSSAHFVNGRGRHLRARNAPLGNSTPMRLHLASVMPQRKSFAPPVRVLLRLMPGRSRMRRQIMSRRNASGRRLPAAPPAVASPVGIGSSNNVRGSVDVSHIDLSGADRVGVQLGGVDGRVRPAAAVPSRSDRRRALRLFARTFDPSDSFGLLPSPMARLFADPVREYRAPAASGVETAGVLA